MKETNQNLDYITDLMKKEQDRTGIKLLWGTANLFSHRRYMNGAATSPDPNIFAFAAAQVNFLSFFSFFFLFVYLNILFY